MKDKNEILEIFNGFETDIKLLKVDNTSSDEFDLIIRFICDAVEIFDLFVKKVNVKLLVIKTFENTDIQNGTLKELGRELYGLKLIGEYSQALDYLGKFKLLIENFEAQVYPILIKHHEKIDISNWRILFSEQYTRRYGITSSFLQIIPNLAKYFIEFTIDSSLSELNKTVDNSLLELNELILQLKEIKNKILLCSGTKGKIELLSPKNNDQKNNIYIMQTKNNPWQSGSFYLLSALLLLFILAYFTSVLAYYMIPIIIIGGIILITIIGALQLKNDDKLKEKNFLKLMSISLKKLRLIKIKRNKIDSDDETTLPNPQ
ncbi:MAG: hypothetical protein AB7S69_12220 [Salinivirgaceae bacterium]